jgi:hypothetical protein
LVQNGQFVVAHLKEDSIKLELFQSDIKHKGFSPRKERQIIEMELQGLSDMELGQTIRQMFNVKS